MFFSLKDKGSLGVVMDNGVLFRGSKEGQVRKAFVEKDLIDTVIGLPSNLFANTGSAGCLVFINKNKSGERKGKILFIDASKDYLEGKAQNHLRQEDIEKTLATYDNYKTVGRYCTVSGLGEIKKNDYNLNISRYVDTTEPEEEIDIVAVKESLAQLRSKRNEIESKIGAYLKELGF